MKRFGFLIASALAMISLPLAAPGIARADSSSGSYDFAVGGGKDAYGGFALSVHCQATGPAVCTEGSTTPPSGHIVKKYPDPSTGKTDEIHGIATCFAVAGPGLLANSAFITWQVTQSDDPMYPVGNLYTFGVQDNGNPNNTVGPDLIGTDLPATTTDDCITESALSIFTSQAVLSGNIVVNTGLPLLGVNMTGDWWQTDTAGNLYILNDTGTWTLVQ